MDVHSECLILQRCRAGEQAAWQELIREYRPRLEAWIEIRLRTKGSVVDDITEAVWTGLAEHPKQLCAFNPVRSRLFSYLVFLAVHHIRRRRRSERAQAARVEPLSEEPATADEGSTLPDSLMLEEIISSLPPRTREITETCVLGSNANLLERPPSRRCMKRVKQYLYRRCREYLSDEGNAEVTDGNAPVQGWSCGRPSGFGGVGDPRRAAAPRRRNAHGR
jgi:DNA-directed RNA polymerase specialized sigma24 family protein